MTYNHSFAILEDRKSKFLSLSGGQQKMVAMGRGLMPNLKLCIIDEPSCGLTPIVVCCGVGNVSRSLKLAQ